jgi:hypothetical protein
VCVCVCVRERERERARERICCSQGVSKRSEAQSHVGISMTHIRVRLLAILKMVMNILFFTKGGGGIPE